MDDLLSMNVLILTGDRDTKWPKNSQHQGEQGHGDFSGAFRPEAARFQAIHGGTIVQIDVSQPKEERFQQVIDAIGRTPRPIDMLAMFCHGWPTGCQLGLNEENAPILAGVLAPPIARSSLIAAMYACSTGSDGPQDGEPAPGARFGLAHVLSDCLAAAGLNQVQVFAHDRSGHATRNPYVMRYGVNEAPRWAIGDGNPVEGLPLWHAWNAAMHGDGDMRLRYPVLSLDEITAMLRMGG